MTSDTLRINRQNNIIAECRDFGMQYEPDDPNFTFETIHTPAMEKLNYSLPPYKFADHQYDFDDFGREYNHYLDFKGVLRRAEKYGVDTTEFKEFVAETCPNAERVVAPSRLFVDMDGVLAEFNPIAKIEDLYEQGYFANLKPQQNVLDAVKLLCNDTRFEVYILSSVLDSPYAWNEKNQWLDTYIPEIDKSHRLFPAYGDKKIWIIPDGLKPTDTLLDDYSVNLNMWCPPGQAIKLMNGINGNHGTWQGARVSHMDSSEKIADAVKNYIETRQAETLKEKVADTIEEAKLTINEQATGIMIL